MFFSTITLKPIGFAAVGAVPAAIVAGGQALKTMGYHGHGAEPEQLRLAGADVTWLRDRFEQRLEAAAGRVHGERAIAVWYRGGWGLGGEGRVRLEAQPLYQWRAAADGWRLDLGATAVATGALTMRAMATRDQAADDSRLVLQLYYYTPLLWGT
mgnify:CR=1 FL=1